MGLAAWTGASGNAYDRSFSCSMTNSDYVTNLIVAINLNFSTFIIPAAGMVLFGACAPGDGRYQRAASCAAAATELLVVCFILILTFLGPPIIDPTLAARFPAVDVVTSEGVRATSAFCSPVVRPTFNGMRGD